LEEEGKGQKRKEVIIEGSRNCPRRKIAELQRDLISRSR